MTPDERNAVIEECAKAAEMQDRVGYEWVRGSLWETITKRAGAAVRALKSMPALEYAPGPCPQCGAATALEAETKCTATQQMSGDYECSGSDCNEDADGRFLFPTAESLVELDKWYDEHGERGCDGQQPPAQGAPARSAE